VSVDYHTEDGTATVADSDYTALSTQTLTFAPGEASKSVTVKVAGDIFFEPDEDFKLVLSNPNPQNASIAKAIGVGIIQNDDTQGYPRPKGASPIRASLVPAYRACTTPNKTHGSPLAYQSCNPPVQLSSYLTVDTPDANGAFANFVGSLQLNVKVNSPPTPSDVMMNANIADVRCKGGVSTCGATNAIAGPDYTGELRAIPQLRITDRLNGSAGTEAATVSEISFPVTVPCAATSDTNIGGTCAISTSANTVIPGSVQSGNRAIWQLGQVQVTDGGEDGAASTPVDNTLFLKQGVFVP
jgi:hypothetical protein